MKWLHVYPHGFVPPTIIIGDDLLQKIAKHQCYREAGVLSAEWSGFRVYGEGLLDVVTKFDGENLIILPNPQTKTPKIVVPRPLMTPTVLIDATNQLSGPMPSHACWSLPKMQGLGVFQIHLDSPIAPVAAAAGSSFECKLEDFISMVPAPSLSQILTMTGRARENQADADCSVSHIALTPSSALANKPRPRPRPKKIAWLNEN